MADYSSLDIRQRSASTETPPEIRRQVEVAKLIDVSKCIGCKACQSACEEWNDLRDDIGVNTGTYQNPHDLTPKSWTLMRFTEYENPETNNLEWLIRKDGCMHCTDPGCLKACPSPGAIVFGTKEAMVEQAHDRVEDLKSRGFDHAGLYDPKGVGGTHVMYVLHHNDKPHLYNGLPDDPKISPLVAFWKGGAKVFGLATMGFAALAGFFHYVTAGPNEVVPEEEEEAIDLKDGRGQGASHASGPARGENRPSA